MDLAQEDFLYLVSVVGRMALDRAALAVACSGVAVAVAD